VFLAGGGRDTSRRPKALLLCTQAELTTSQAFARDAEKQYAEANVLRASLVRQQIFDGWRCTRRRMMMPRGCSALASSSWTNCTTIFGRGVRCRGRLGATAIVMGPSSGGCRMEKQAGMQRTIDELQQANAKVGIASRPSGTHFWDQRPDGVLCPVPVGGVRQGNPLAGLGGRTPADASFGTAPG
jgi:hypothetical protein